MLALLALAVSLCAGCGAHDGYAISTGGAHKSHYRGDVYLTFTQAPPRGRELGIVEARGSGDDADIQRMMDVLIAKGRKLGANTIAVDWLGAEFTQRPDWRYNDPWQGGACMAARCTAPYGLSRPQTLMEVVLRGRALWIDPKALEGGETP